MNDEISVRADPDVLLSAITKKQSKKKGGKLSLFIGMAPGVGKTYSMLLAAQEAKKNGLDIVVAVVESHGRKDTEKLLEGLEVIPKRKLLHRGHEFLEMDIDALLARKPTLALVDELAHTNIPGSRHSKRWQDVFELLDAGIDVYSTLNVQHLDSRKEAVEKIAKISILESVPDSVLDRAFQIQLIDLSVPDLLRRLKEGKVYLGEKAELAAAHFFKEDKLTALREIALRVAAERVDSELQSFVTEREAGKLLGAADRVMVAIGYGQGTENIIRSARRIAYNLDASFIAVHISKNDLVSEKDQSILAKNLELARNLGAEVVSLSDTSIVNGIIRIAVQKDVSQIIVGRSEKTTLGNFLKMPSLHEQLIDKCSIDVLVMGQKTAKMPKLIKKISDFTMQKQLAPLSKAFILSILLILVNLPLAPMIGYRAVGFLLLLGILIFGLFLPLGAVLFASIVTMISWNYFFIPPVGTFYIKQPEDLFLATSFLVAALATGVLTRRISYQQEILISREMRSQSLNQILLDIAIETSPKGIANAVSKHISGFLKGRADIVLVKKDKSITSFLGQELQLSNLSRELTVAKWTIENNKAAGRFTETLSSAEALYIPLKGSFEMMGALAFQSQKPRVLSLEDMDFLFTVARQIALSLEKQQFRKIALESFRLAESEKTYQRLFKDLAQELKALAQKSSINPKIINTIDNFLIAARLSAGIFPLKKESLNLKSLALSSVERLRQIFPEQNLDIAIEGDTSSEMVNVERDLILQAITNILVNAVQHAPKTKITLEIKPHEIIFKDQGPGISEEDSGRIFEKFYRSEKNKEGYGLGLAIAKGVLKAHEGKISAVNNPSGGLSVTLTFPLNGTT